MLPDRYPGSICKVLDWLCILSPKSKVQVLCFAQLALLPAHRQQLCTSKCIDTDLHPAFVLDVYFLRQNT